MVHNIVLFNTALETDLHKKVGIFLFGNNFRNQYNTTNISGEKSMGSLINKTNGNISTTMNVKPQSNTIHLSPSIEIGERKPCLLIPGPCAIENNIREHLFQLSQQGYKIARGGAWKPRSSTESFRGFGKRGLIWFMEAAKDYGFEGICTEVIDTSHIQYVREAREETGYTGSIILWIGARTGNQILLETLGDQNEFPILVKNGLHDQSPKEVIKKTSWIESGSHEYDEHAQRLTKRIPHTQVAVIWRGVERGVPDGYRFNPVPEAIQELKARTNMPVIVDPSHSAGTTVNDLVYKNLQRAMEFHPDAILLETKPDEHIPICDAAQAVPVSDLPRFQMLIKQKQTESLQPI